MTTTDDHKPINGHKPVPQQGVLVAQRDAIRAIRGERPKLEIDTSEPVLPETLRDRSAASAAAKVWWKRTSYRAKRQAVQAPVVMLWLLVYSPRGLGRLVAWIAKWVYDQDSANLRHEHAGNRETAEYARAHAVRKANLHARGLVFVTGLTLLVGPVLAWTAPYVLSTIVAVALFLWTVKLIPGKEAIEYVVALGIAGAVWFFLPMGLELIPHPPAWVVVLVAVAVVFALGWLGRNKEKAPVRDTKVMPADVVMPLRAPMVTAALVALGNSKMKNADDIRLLMDVARQGQGYQIDLDLPPGIDVAEDVMKHRAKFASALRRELGCVWPSVGKRHPGHLSLYVSDEPMSKAKQAPWPLLKDGTVDLFAPQPMFTNNIGEWVKASFAYTGWVVGAVPRMGKTYLVRQFGLVAGLDVRAKVLAFDLKGTGDLSPLAKFAHAYSVGDEPEDVAIQLEWMRWVRAEMRRRTKLVRELTLEENPEKGKVTSALATRSPAKFGPIVVCVDECQVWFEEFDEALLPADGGEAMKGQAVREEFTAICRDLIKRGPALGVIVLFATQKPDAKSIPTAIADNASCRVCFKVNGQVSNDQVLGTSSYQVGIRATQFGFEDKGVAYFRGEGADALIKPADPLPGAVSRLMRETVPIGLGGDLVARVRWARRCGARRSDKQPCKAYAIVGGFTCRVHGGSIQRVRQEASIRFEEQRLRRGFDVSWRRWKEERLRWQVRQIVVTAGLLGKPWQEVDWVDMVLCRVEHGRPELPSSAPKFRMDQRYGRRLRPAPHGES